MDSFLLLAVIVPFAGAGVVALFPKRQIALLCSGISLGLLCGFIPEIDKTTHITFTFWMNPLHIRMVIDGFSLAFALLISFLFFIVILYSSYMEGRKYYCLLLTDLGLLLSIAFSHELLSFYVFLEMFTVVTYFLVAYKETDEAIAAGFKYLIMNVGGAVFILLGILLKGDSLASFLFMAGCLVKAGSVPVHVWLADAHPAAPSPVSALLSGVMVKTGAYGLFRYAPWFGADGSEVILLASASMVFGVFLALVQSDVKRILAYHTVSQVGFILLGIGLQSTEGISGGMLHLVNHGLFKALLFLSIGCVIRATGERNIHHLGGLRSTMPVTAAACLVGCLSISGIPPFNGFASKTLLFHALDSDVLKAVFIITCAGTVASFIKLFRHTFLGEPKSSAKNVPVSMKIPLLALSGLCILLGVFPGIALSFTGYTASVWSTSALSECFLSVSLGAVIYVVGLRTRIIVEPPHTKIAVDRFFRKSGRAVEFSSKMLNKMLTQDVNYYAMSLVLMLILLFFLFNI